MNIDTNITITTRYVIAKYKEDISWTDSLKDERIVVDKSLPEYPNIGRESETYLKYIIDNYDNLPDVVVFSQGNISDHFVYYHRGQNNPVLLKLLAQDALAHGMSTNIATNFLPNNWDEHWNYNQQNNEWYMTNNYKNNNHRFFGDWFKEMFGITLPFPLNIYWSAIFAVRKDYILKNKIEFYKKLIEEVNWHVDPVEGHFMERSWYYIFRPCKQAYV